MKLWQKEYSIYENIEQFTVGQDRELDLQLAKYDVIGSLAHSIMLESIGLLQPQELPILTHALKVIYEEIEKGSFEIAENVEDVHSQVEVLLTQRLGEIGKKIHSGRSRNDQVLVDLRLFLRAEIEEIAKQVHQLVLTFLAAGEKYKTVLMPGYTHLQIGMVSSFGLWFGAYAESLIDDLRLLESTYRIVNQNPLGSAAGYGSSFPLNRTLTTQLLGFDDLNYNVIHAQMGRGKTELFAGFALAAIAHTIGKMAMDVTLFCNQNFNFLSLPKELTTGSSIMPHKKNPDIFELIRAKCNQILALPNTISMITSNLPSGYHRDFQILKETVFPAFASIKNCLEMVQFALPLIQVHQHLLTDSKYQYLYTVEVVNQAVWNGLPFREAYQQVSKTVEDGTFQQPRLDLQSAA
jgi:argininosuccinate lyase